MPNVKTPVLLLGEDLTLLGAVRCFGRAGVPAYVVTGPDPLARHSRWFQTLPDDEIGPHDYAALSSFLRRIDLESAVVVPCSDPWAAAAARLEPDLVDRFPTVVASGDVIDMLVDKGRFGQMLVEADIPHPRTYALEGPASLEQIPDEVFTAGFLKPTNSVAFVEAFGIKAFDFRSREEAERLLARAEGAGHGMMLQEYIPGGADQHYFVDGFVDRHGAFTVRFARRRLRIFPVRFGNSTAVYSVPLDDVDGALGSLEALVERTGFRGIFSAEFKRDARDGSFKLIEVNPRPWWYVEFAATAGADVCVPAYRDALGETVEPIGSYRVGARLVYPSLDWLAWRHMASNTTSLRELLGFWAGASQAHWCVDDPLPAMLASGRESWSLLTRRARRLVGAKA